MPGKLSDYHAKRNFRITPEPKGEIVEPAERLRFVVQKHHARKLHYDFRLEMDGTLKSWAVPKGPSLDPSDKRLAVHVEDHPLDYIDFEGDIPEKQYGAGHVDVWDTGTWEPQGDPVAAYKAGKIKFRLDGEKLHGGWTLVRTRLPGGSKEQWLLVKEKDEAARSAREYDITEAEPDSVLRKPKTNDAALVSRKRSALPHTLVPQLATLVEDIPRSGDWMYEIKFDGYRLLARVDGDDVKLFTRDGKDWTAKLPAQAEAIRALKLENGWLDGEIVCLDKQDVPNFQLLQKAIHDHRSKELVYFLFDLPWLNGFDLRKTPLHERRALLEQALSVTSPGILRYSAPIAQPPQELLDTACRLSMEGIIGKRTDAPYESKRSDSWIKLKCRRRQEFVIGGYTEPNGSRKFFGALLLGVYDDGKLRYAGRVGTGFDRTVLHDTYKALHVREQKTNPFDHMPSDVRKAETHWVKPELVAEISFAEWTDDGMLRQAVFHGLRMDKPASDIRREEAASVPVNGKQIVPVPPRKSPAGAKVQGVKVTHPERVIDPASGLTKIDLVRYYEQVADRLLPWLHNRPVYLLRCPDGVTGEHFFQKHINRTNIPGIRTLDPALDPDHDPLMVIDSVDALVGAAQMGAIELHTCNATADRIDKPDCMVFDLDPDPSLPWKRVAEGARLVRVVLDELGLHSFLKTSGGKGLHLVVPLARRQTWDDVSAFSQAVARHLATTLPRYFSAKMGEKNRVGKIFVDYLRNKRQASTVAPYSVRARPGLPVAVPIGWDELDVIKGAAEWTIATLPERLSMDPWKDYAVMRQTLTKAMRKTLGLD
ncbi:DNA ligase D [Noviherbaspirillum sp. ST9]|uniref:DNA ligase D n=1 Tax=Noviherbaspirillum sp. ST9 TaxID=3401606 RepID=UPI003B587240